MSCACAQEPRHRIALQKIVSHGADTYSLDFISDSLNRWKEGDSSKLYLQIGDKLPGKKFSYATLPDEGLIRFTTRLKGVNATQPSPFKRALFELLIGDTLEITVPKGEFYLRRDNRPIILLSNGVGIAAVRALVKAYEKDANQIPYLAQINVDARGEIYSDEFKEIAGKGGSFMSYYTKNRHEFSQRFEEVLDQVQVTYMRSPYFYIVGSEAFVNQTAMKVALAGYDTSDIILDQGGSCGCSISNLVQLTS